MKTLMRAALALLLLTAVAAHGAMVIRGPMAVAVGGCGTPPSFPASDVTDDFAGTGGVTLSTYNASRYASISGFSQAGIVGGGGATGRAGNLGDPSAFNQILDAPSGNCFDIAFRNGAGLGASAGSGGGICFNMTALSTTADGYCLIANNTTNRHIELFKVVGGDVFSTSLDTSTVINFNTGDGYGIRWNNGTWQLYYYDDSAPWLTTGTGGTDTTHTSGYWFIFSGYNSGAPQSLDDLIFGGF